MIEPIVFLGRLVTFDDGKVIDDGALYVGADEKIAAVQKASDPAPEGFDGARRVRTGGAIYPSLRGRSGPWNSGWWARERAGLRSSTSRSNGTSWCA